MMAVHQHVWSWETHHKDGSYSHGRCTVEGCKAGGESHVGAPASAQAPVPAPARLAYVDTGTAIRRMTQKGRDALLSRINRR